MPPKQDKISTDRPYGLSDAELKTSICVLRLLAIDGNTPIDKLALAKLTGHDKPNTAVKIWSNARAKLVAANAGAPDNPTAGDTAAMAPATKPAKRARQSNKTKAAGGGKKVAAIVEEDEEDEDDDDGLAEPAPKRVKGVTKQQVEDDSF